jgi:hypothetical protein
MLVLGLLIGAAATAQAGNGPTQANRTTTKNQKVLPVLVKVSSSGKITRVDPAYTLRAGAVRELLRSTLEKIVTGPAHYKGKAVASQMVINMAVNKTPSADGSYAVSFHYVSAQPVPAGHWGWSKRDPRRRRPLQLVNLDMQNLNRRAAQQNASARMAAQNAARGAWMQTARHGEVGTPKH